MIKVVYRPKEGGYKEIIYSSGPMAKEDIVRQIKNECLAIKAVGFDRFGNEGVPLKVEWEADLTDDEGIALYELSHE